MDRPDDAEPRNALAGELRWLRRAAGLSQRKMAAALGLSAHSAVADYETGKRIPAGDILTGYERVFGPAAAQLRRLRAEALAQRAAAERPAPAPAAPSEDTPAPDEQAPAPDGQAPASDQHAPASEGRAPVSDQHAPASEGRAPVSDQHAPASDGRASASDEHAPAPDEDTPAPDEDESAPLPVAAPVPLSRRRRLVVAAAVATALAIGVAAGAAASASNSAAPSSTLASGWTETTQNHRILAGSEAPPEDMDGDDPRARGCGADVETLDQVPMYLPRAHTVFGTLRLRRSRHCGTEWASAYYQNPRLYTVTLGLHRPADDAQVRSDWSNNTPPGSYGDMLSTAPGCVWAEAVVTTPTGRSAPVRTRCLR